MYRLSSIVTLVLLSVSLFSQSPHGESLKINCASCHDPSGWASVRDTLIFDHASTSFELEGRHEDIDCKSCHMSLIFSSVNSNCIDCHTDVHSMTVGNDCARCHGFETWLVNNIPEIHEENGFPLIGAHNSLSCVECHVSETNLKFDRLGNDCISCHQLDYNSAQNPNHMASGFSTDCIECHDPLGFGWGATLSNHDFFPLEQGHDIADCAQCHTDNTFSSASPECVSCHLADYTITSDPNHQAAQFPQDCEQCHTIAGWTPATFEHDGQFFPIYSGTHNGEWSECMDCHTNPNNYAEFTCVSCHMNPETDSDHNGISGYIYESVACLACHPNGLATEGFDHNTTDFPLHGGHNAVDCIQCHSDGYAGTPTNCDACHMPDYNGTTNPNHVLAGFPTDCALCHTDTGWEPSSFDHNTTQFPIMGGHVGVDCVQCHADGYVGTPTNCDACHMDDYNSVNSPNHSAANFPLDCTQCHTQNAWDPSTFDHDSQHFPIYSGKHEGEWDACVDCHINPNDYSVFSCTVCHSQNSTNNDHDEVNNYVYESNACFECHPDGSD